MYKNKTRIERLMISLLMAAILCFGIATPVFAESGDTDGPVTNGTESAGAKAGITKVLMVAEGTEIPARIFEFSFTAKEVAQLSVPEGDMPAIDPAYISFTAADAEIAKDAGGGIVSVTKEKAEDIFKDVVWPHAGVYVYTVEETDRYDNQINYTTAKYDVYVYVANKEAEGGLFVKAIVAGVLMNDASNTGALSGTKVDATLGGGQGFTCSQMIFTNTYNKKVDETDPEIIGNQKLNVSVTVSGAYGDKTRYFDLLVDIKKPGTIGEEADYRGYVLEMVKGELKVVTSAENSKTLVMPSDMGSYIPVRTGRTAEIKLRHGQQLVFTGIHDGASYIVTEKAAADYKASVKITENGVAGVIELANTNLNEDRSTAPDDNANLMRIINGTGNKAAFNNEYKEVTPMGVGVDTLPYIMLVIVVMAAFMGYVTLVFRRNSKEED